MKSEKVLELFGLFAYWSNPDDNYLDVFNGKRMRHYKKLFWKIFVKDLS